jgi:hypothetical protein
LKRFLRLVFGTVFLILGVLGLFLPVLQGILFLIVGLLILAPESRRIRELLAFLRKKYPAVFEHAERLKRKYTRSGSNTEEHPAKTDDNTPENHSAGKHFGSPARHPEEP